MHRFALRFYKFSQKSLRLLNPYSWPTLPSIPRFAADFYPASPPPQKKAVYAPVVYIIIRRIVELVWVRNVASDSVDCAKLT